MNGLWSHHGRSTRFADDELAVEEDVAGRKVSTRDAFEHRRKCCVPDLPGRLPQRGQRHGEKFGVLEIVDSDDANIAGNSVTEPQQCRNQARRRSIIGADERLGPLMLHELANRCGISRVNTMHQRTFDRCVPGVQRFAVTGFARIDRGGRVRESDEGNPSRPVCTVPAVARRLV